MIHFLFLPSLFLSVLKRNMQTSKAFIYFGVLSAFAHLDGSENDCTLMSDGFRWC